MVRVQANCNGLIGDISDFQLLYDGKNLWKLKKANSTENAYYKFNAGLEFEIIQDMRTREEIEEEIKRIESLHDEKIPDNKIITYQKGFIQGLKWVLNKEGE